MSEFKIQRYEHDGYAGFNKHKDGPFVMFSDIEKLIKLSESRFKAMVESQREIEKLKAENKRLQDQIIYTVDAIREDMNENAATIAKLTRQNEIMKKALEFYGDKKNWLRDKDGWRHDMIIQDLDDETLTEWEGRFSGKRARKALQECEGVD